MSSKRLEKIKNARSIGDILDVLSDIRYEYKNSSATVARLTQSLSGEIVMDSRKKSPGVHIDTTYVHPDIKGLKRHLDVVNSMHDNLEELAAAEALVKQAFAGHKKQKAALDAIRALRDDVEASVNDAYVALDHLSSSTQPKKFESFCDSVVNELISILPSKSYTSMSREVYASPDQSDKTLIHFCSYIGIEGLKNVQGFMYDVYYIVVTGVVNKSGVIEYYVNGLPDFKGPCKYPLGNKCATLNEAKRRIELLLDHNNFVVDLERKPLPFDEQRAKTSGIHSIRGVEGVKIKDDELFIILQDSVKTERVAKNISLECRARLNGIVGAKRNAILFQEKFVKLNGKRAIKFILVPNLDRRANFSIQRLDEAAEVLNLSTRQKAALRFALQHPDSIAEQTEQHIADKKS